VAADLAAGWADSARLRLERAAGGSAGRERDLWVLLVRATGLPALGDWQSAVERVRSRLGAAPDTDAVAHWLLARVGVERSHHAAALARLARGTRGPLPASLAADLDARDALARHDTTRALALWDGATRRYAVLSVPLELVSSLWPLRLDIARVATAQRHSAIATRACRSFETLIGYVDQVVQPEVQRLSNATP